MARGGGTLGSRNRGRGGFVTIRDTVVTPTEQTVQQAKSEIKHRQDYKKTPDGVRLISRVLTTKRARSSSRTPNRHLVAALKKTKKAKPVQNKRKYSDIFT